MEKRIWQIGDAFQSRGRLYKITDIWKTSDNEIKVRYVSITDDRVDWMYAIYLDTNIAQYVSPEKLMQLLMEQ